jgi:hypothetical protein
MARRLSSSIPDPGAFRTGAAYYVDSVIRLPKSSKVTINPTGMCVAAKTASNVWSSLIEAFPIFYRGASKDFQNLRTVWNRSFSRAITSVFTQPNLAERPLAEYLLKTNGGNFPRTIACFEHAILGCDDEDFGSFQNASHFLFALGLNKNEANWVPLQVERPWDPLTTQVEEGTKLSACAIVGEYNPWSLLAHADFPDRVLESPQGYLFDLRRVCITFAVHFKDQNEYADFVQGALPYDEWVWNHYFYPIIDKEFDKGASLMKDRHPALTNSTAAIQGILKSKQNLLNAAFEKNLSNNEIATTVERFKTDLYVFIFFNAIMKPDCHAKLLKGAFDAFISAPSQQSITTFPDEFPLLIKNHSYREVERYLDQPLIASAELADYGSCYFEPSALNQGRMLIGAIGAWTNKGAVADCD